MRSQNKLITGHLETVCNICTGLLCDIPVVFFLIGSVCMYVCMYVRYIWCHVLHWILIAKHHFLCLQFSLCLIKCNWIFFCETFILWLYICSCKMVFKTNSCELNTLVLGMVVFFLSFFVWNFLKIIVLLLTNNSAVFIIIFSVNLIKIRSVHLLPPFSLSLCREIKIKGGLILNITQSN